MVADHRRLVIVHVEVPLDAVIVIGVAGGVCHVQGRVHQGKTPLVISEPVGESSPPVGRPLGRHRVTGILRSHLLHVGNNGLEPRQGLRREIQIERLGTQCQRVENAARRSPSVGREIAPACA